MKKARTKAAKVGKVVKNIKPIRQSRRRKLECPKWQKKINEIYQPVRKVKKQNFVARIGESGDEKEVPEAVEPTRQAFAFSQTMAISQRFSQTIAISQSVSPTFSPTFSPIFSPLPSQDLEDLERMQVDRVKYLDRRLYPKFPEAEEPTPQACPFSQTMAISPSLSPTFSPLPSQYLRYLERRQDPREMVLGENVVALSLGSVLTLGCDTQDQGWQESMATQGEIGQEVTQGEIGQEITQGEIGQEITQGEIGQEEKTQGEIGQEAAELMPYFEARGKGRICVLFHDHDSFFRRAGVKERR